MPRNLANCQDFQTAQHVLIVFFSLPSGQTLPPLAAILSSSSFRCLLCSNVLFLSLSLSLISQPPPRAEEGSRILETAGILVLDIGDRKFRYPRKIPRTGWSYPRRRHCISTSSFVGSSGNFYIRTSSLLPLDPPRRVPWSLVLSSTLWQFVAKDLARRKLWIRAKRASQCNLIDWLV